jgi:aminoglycoside 6'-N-acetyltransferase I
MSVRPLRPDDMEVWIEMRAALWPETSPGDHHREAREVLAGKRGDGVFLAVAPGGDLVGFIELSLRPYAGGCTSSPVAYVEGWYVRPQNRRRGHGRDLMTAAERWARGCGCSEMASDTELTNRLSQNLHRRLGFETVDTIVQFRKSL